MLRKKLKLNKSNDDETEPIKKESLENEGDSPPKQTKLITSKYFSSPFWLKLLEIECELNEDLKDLKFTSPVAAVYNPAIYAIDLIKAYLEKFLDGPKSVVFIGMNPGPWGMCQTGVNYF